MLLIHAADDRCRAADRLIAHADRLRGLDIGKAVVVDYLQYLGLLKAACAFSLWSTSTTRFLRGRSR